MEDTLSKFMSESAKRHEENSNLIKEIRATIDAAIRNQGALIKTLEIQIGQMSKNSTLLYKSRQTTVPFPSRLDNHYCEEEEGNYERKFTEVTLRVGEDRIVFTSVNPDRSLIKRVYMLSLRERIELYLEARLIGETLVLNRSLDIFSEDYIELNDLNEPFELRRNQGDDLRPTINEGE
ncbi:hypothetical protein Tco_0181609, partial [Tanacetum coccineum]